MPHDFICGIGDEGIFCNALQIRTDEAQKLAFVIAFDLIDPFDRLLVEKTATEPVHGVRGINDKPAVP